MKKKLVSRSEIIYGRYETIDPNDLIKRRDALARALERKVRAAMLASGQYKRGDHGELIGTMAEKPVKVQKKHVKAAVARKNGAAGAAATRARRSWSACRPRA